MRIGFFSRQGKHLVGQIGDLTLTWDRHQGGRLGVSYLVAGKPTPVGHFGFGAKLEGATLGAADDPDPRLIQVEAGPHRLVLRAVQRLYDAAGIHLGDAMQETWAWADDSLYLNAMLRLINSQRGGRLIEAAAGFAFADGWASAHGEGLRLVHGSGRHLAVVCCEDGSPWAVPLGIENPTPNDVRLNVWESLEAGPPYYRRWGPYYDQWGGPGGWSSLKLEDGPTLRAVWTENELHDRGPTEGFHGTLALLAADNGAALEQKVRAFEEPLNPSVEGGKSLYYSPMEGTTVIRKKITSQCEFGTPLS
jgi:hypothetical protein